MKKLTESSKLFHDIIYHIWQLLTYYADYFGYDVPASAHRLSVGLFYDRTLTKIRVSVPCIKEFESKHTVEEIRAIMNESIAILLQGSSLQPFAAGKNFNEIVEPLFITILVSNGLYCDMDFLWVDNLDAYEVVKKNELESILTII